LGARGAADDQAMARGAGRSTEQNATTQADGVCRGRTLRR
jgi:hypothetical protein